MQLFAAIAVATALCASSTSATCYNDGIWWGDQGHAEGKLRDACNKMKGTYKPSEVFTQCRNGVGQTKYDFEVRNQNQHAISLSYDTCVTNLRREIIHCSRGGYETWSGVRMKADPNFGRC